MLALRWPPRHKRNPHGLGGQQIHKLLLVGLKPIGMLPSTRQGKEEQLIVDARTRWGGHDIIHKARASRLTMSSPHHPSPHPPFHSSMITCSPRQKLIHAAHPFLYPTTWAHKTLAPLARCNKPGDFILAHFTMCGARHAGATDEEIPRIQAISHPSKCPIYRFVTIHFKWLWLD